MKTLNTIKALLSITLIALFVFALNVNSAKAQVIGVIASEDVDIDKLTKEDLFKIYSQQKKFWDNGSEIKLVDYNSSAMIRKAFFGKLNKDSSFFEKLWQRNKFQGEANPPAVASNEKSMVDEISNSSGAIGFVPITQVKPGVKLLLQF